MKLLDYRADIDGLRAVAILGVLVFHIDPSLLGGGFVGVDVFFVISGFLIASIIHRDVAAGRFSLVEFYEKRIRRIVPALFVMMLVACLCALRVLLPHELIDFGQSVRYAVFSLSNLYFLDASQGYFDAEVSRMPLLHTWSLAVEEQFYVVFPLLVLAGHRFFKGRKALVGLLALVGLVSLGLSEWRVARDAASAFYGLPWRAWEMLLGALLALAPLGELRRWQGNLAGSAGLAMILGSMLGYDEHTGFPGISALLPCAGATLVIWSGRDRQAWAARLLSWKPLVGIGLISYSVYLWHWPLIVFSRYLFGSSPALATGLAVASLAMGYLSWRFVERPFRDRSFLNRRNVFAGWAAASAVFLAASIAVKQAEGFPGAYPAEVQGYLKDRVWPQSYRSDAEKTYEPDFAPVYGNAQKIPSIALWGDSHAQSLMPMLDAIGEEKGVAIRGYSMNAQMPVTGVTVVGLDEPELRSDFSAEVLDDLIRDAGIRTVILQARWNAYFHGNNEDARMEPPTIVGESFDTAGERERFIAGRLNETVTRLLEAGKKVVLVYPFPEPGLKVPDHVARIVLAGGAAPNELPLPGFDERTRAVEAMFEPYKLVHGVSMIDPTTKLLAGTERVKIREGGRLLYRDTNHLSVTGSFYLRGLFEPLF